MRYAKFSYRFGEEVLNSKLALKNEIEDAIRHIPCEKECLDRPGLNRALNQLLSERGWTGQPDVFGSGEGALKLDFLKERIGMEIQLGHSSFLGIDILKLQVMSYSYRDAIDVGVYLVTTRQFQREAKTRYGANWDGSLNYEKVVRLLPYFKSAIQIPIFVIGLEF